MSDLISRSSLIKALTTYKFGCLSHEVEREYVKEVVIDFVKTEPTAYDVKKAIELEVRSTYYRYGKTVLNVYPILAKYDYEIRTENGKERFYIKFKNFEEVLQMIKDVNEQIVIDTDNIIYIFDV